MQLTKPYLAPGALVNYTQVGHRRTAIEYTIAGIVKIHDANLNLLGRDQLTSEMEGVMRDWVIETLLQGAYLREYHLWEKDCKAYFPTMAARNGPSMTMKTKGGQTFTGLMRDILSSFEIVISDEIMNPIDQMRQRVNVMKHDAGLELDHFIAEKDYEAAVTALEGFWEYLAGCDLKGEVGLNLRRAPLGQFSRTWVGFVFWYAAAHDITNDHE
jgi:hypothetical protein